MLKRVLGALLLQLVLVLAAQRSALAEPEAFQRTISEAVAHFDAGRFEKARERFAQAHALSPSARTLRALGMVEFELRHYVDSVGYLEQALSSRVKPLDAPLRREAHDVLARANKEVARLRLSVSPPEASVSLDGAVLPPGHAQPLLLLPGEHQLVLRAPGRRDEQRTVALAASEQRELVIALAPLPDVRADREPARDGGRPLYRNPWLWSGVGVAVVALVTGLAVGLSASDGTRPARAYGGDTNAVLSGP